MPRTPTHFIAINCAFLTGAVTGPGNLHAGSSVGAAVRDHPFVTAMTPGPAEPATSSG